MICMYDMYVSCSFTIGKKGEGGEGGEGGGGGNKRRGGGKG